MPPKKTQAEKASAPVLSMRLQQKMMESMQSAPVKAAEEVNKSVKVSNVGRPRKNKEADEAVNNETSASTVGSNSSVLTTTRRSARSQSTVNYSEDVFEEVESGKATAKLTKTKGVTSSVELTVVEVDEARRKQENQSHDEKTIPSTPAEVQASILSQRRKTVVIETSSLTASQAVALAANSKSKRKRNISKDTSSDDEAEDEVDDATPVKKTYPNTGSSSSSGGVGSRSTKKPDPKSDIFYVPTARDLSPDRTTSAPTSGPVHNSISSGSTSYKRKSFGQLNESSGSVMTAAAAATIEEELSRDKAGLWVEELEKRMEQNEVCSST